MLPVLKGSAAFRRGAGAFSLLEMLITIVLIIIMFVMLYGHGAGGQQLARKRKCQKNLQDLHVALQIFANDRDGLLPTLTGAITSEPVLAQLVPKYISLRGAFICPASKDSSLPEGES